MCLCDHIHLSSILSQSCACVTIVTPLPKMDFVCDYMPMWWEQDACESPQPTNTQLEMTLVRHSLTLVALKLAAWMVLASLLLSSSSCKCCLCLLLAASLGNRDLLKCVACIS